MGNFVRCALLIGAIVIGCQPIPGPGPGPSVDASDASLAKVDAGACFQPGPTDDCLAAGLKLCKLGCRAGDMPLWVTPKGTPYAEVCRRAKADGRDRMANGHSRAKCLATLTDCAHEGDCR